MALQSSGAISMNDINVELTYAGTATISLNDAAVRALAGVASGQISFSDFYGKSFVSDSYLRYASVLMHFEATDNNRNVFVDSSPSANTITNAGGTYEAVYASADSPYNSRGVAYRFGGLTPNGYGSSNGAYIPDHTSVQFGTGAFTVEFWVKVQDISFGSQSLSGSVSFLRKNLAAANPTTAGSASISNWSFNLYDDTTTSQAGFGKLALLIGGSYDQYSSAPSFFPSAGEDRISIADGSWHHVAWIRDSSGYSTLFLDGRVYVNLGLSLNGVSIGDANPNDASLNKICIAGYLAQSSNQPVAGFIGAGHMSNLRIVKGSAVYTHNTPFTVPTSPLTAISGTSVLTFHTTRCIDGSSNNHAIVLSQTQDANARVAASLVGNGPFGLSTEFDASTGVGSICINQFAYLSTPWLTSPISAIGTGDFTLEFWVKSALSTENQISGNPMSLLVLGTSWADAAGIRIYSSQYQKLSVSVGALNLTIALFADGSGNGNDNPVARVWNHIAITRSGTTVRLYKNGVHFASGTSAANLSATALAIFAADGSGTSKWAISGNLFPPTKLSDLRIVSGTAVYTGTGSFTPPTSPLATISGTIFHCKARPTSYYSKTGNPTADPVTTWGFSSTSPALSSAYSKFGTKSLYITGNAGLTWTDSIFDNGANYTTEFWAYFPTLGASSGQSWNNRGYIWGSTVGNNIYGYDKVILSMVSDGRLYMSGTYMTAGVYSSSLSAGYLYLTANTWYHIAISRFGQNFRVFVNGQLWIATGIIASNYNPLFPSEFDPGTSYYANFLPTRCAFLGAPSSQIEDNVVSANMYVDELRITAGYVRYWTNFTAPTAKFLDIGTPKAQPPDGGQAIYVNPPVGASTKTYSFVVPTGVTSISAFVLGGGGGAGVTWGSGSGGGGGSAYGTIAVTPGETLTVEVGRAGLSISPRQDGTGSRILRGGTLLLAGYGGTYLANSGGGYYINTGSVTNYGGGTGGTGVAAGSGYASGGGAAGYGGNGGAGTNLQDYPGGDGTSNTGAGRGGQGGTQYSNSENVGSNIQCDLNTEYYVGGARGNGVGPYGLHYNTHTGYYSQAAFPSSDLRGWWVNNNPFIPDSNYVYGGGAGGSGYVYSNNAYEYFDENTQEFMCGENPGINQYTQNNGLPGVVRIIWGPNRSYPGTNTHDIITT